MKKRLLLCVILGLAILGLGCKIDPAAFQQSIRRLDIWADGWEEYGTGGCTAWSINEPLGYWITAAHCADHLFPLTIDGEVAQVVRVDQGADLALLQGPHRYALRVSPTKPRVREHVLLVGYWGGSDLMTMAEGEIIEHDRPYPTTPVIWIHNMVVRLPYAPLRGTSGGPVFDGRGNVVSVMQGFECETCGMMATWTDLRVFTMSYKEKW